MAPMGGGSKLAGAEVKRLQEALLDAFRTRSELARMVRVGLDESLDAVVAHGDLRAAVFDLIEWAEAHGRLDDMIAAARRENEGNPELRAFVEDRARIEPPPTAVGDPPGGPSLPPARPPE